MRLQTLFWRCPACGAELLNTIDLEAPRAPRSRLERFLGLFRRRSSPAAYTAPVCRCGATMAEAGIPRIALPKSGGYDRVEYAGEDW